MTEEQKNKIIDLSMKIASDLVKKEFPNEQDRFKYHLYVYRQGAQAAIYELLHNFEKYKMEIEK
jgi:2'-5' RNA ligase